MRHTVTGLVDVFIISGGGELFSLGILDPAIRASLSKDEVVRLVRRQAPVHPAARGLLLRF